MSGIASDTRAPTPTGGRPVGRVRATGRVTPLGLMLALTFVTGVVDAVGYLHLDQVFAGNMTGNVVILGMAATGASGLPVLGPFVALIFFLVGAAVAGRVLRTAALIIVGAVSGAVLCQVHEALAVVTAAVVVLAVTGLGHTSVRSAEGRAATTNAATP